MIRKRAEQHQNKRLHQHRRRECVQRETTRRQVLPQQPHHTLLSLSVPSHRPIPRPRTHAPTPPFWLHTRRRPVPEQNTILPCQLLQHNRQKRTHGHHSEYFRRYGIRIPPVELALGGGTRILALVAHARRGERGFVIPVFEVGHWYPERVGVFFLGVFTALDLG